MFKLLINYLLILLFISCNNSQHFEIPPVACPNYFQYYFDDFEYVGRISIPGVANNIELVVNLSQKRPLQTNYYGRIILENKNPITYRLEFPSTREIPKITKITVNGEDICAQSGYPAPSTKIFLTHKLTTQALSSTLPQIPTQHHSTNTNPFQQSPTTFVQIPSTNQYPQIFNNNKFDISSEEDPQTFVPPVRKDEQCGLGSAIKPLIFGGEGITRGEFPWLTAIYVKSAGLRFLCGGSLVSARTVISAGHCFQIGSLTASRLVVHLGRHNLEDFSEQNFVTREIQNLLVHPEYSSNVFPDADLAILQLKQSVRYANNISPICLWTADTDTRFIIGKAGVVAGWGADEQGRKFTPEPKKINTKIVSDSECLRSSAAYNLLTSPRTFCAGNRDDTGPCMGDSGSGLMISRNGLWYLRGIVSAGQTKDRKCNLQEFVVFCDVAKHLKWLQNNLVS